MRTATSITEPPLALGSGEEAPPDDLVDTARVQYLEAALAHSPVLVWAADRGGTLVLVGGAGSLLAGLPSEAVLGQPVDKVFHDIPELLDHFRQALAGNAATGAAEIHDGLVMDCWTSPLRDAPGEIAGVAGVAVDATARQASERRLLAEWRTAEERLRAYKEERKLIAHEIHDGLIQEATAAQMRLEALLESGRVPAGACKQEVELALGLVRNTVLEARQLILGLRPPVLEERGLVEAVRHLIASQEPGGPVVGLVVPAPLPRLEPPLETAVYRIVQEALNNVRRHSRSDRAEVRITQRGRRVEVEVQDWGAGFDTDRVDERRLGLKGIRQRAQSLRGQAEIQSAPGKGTRVRVDLPLAEPSQVTSLSNDRSNE